MSVTANNYVPLEPVGIRNTANEQRIKDEQLARLLELEAEIGGPRRSGDDRERWTRASSAGETGDHCGKCGRPFAAGEHIARIRLGLGSNRLTGGYVRWMTPVCDDCAAAWRTPPWSWTGDCEGCGRPVTTWIAGTPRDPWCEDGRRCFYSRRCRMVEQARARKAECARPREAMTCDECGGPVTASRVDALYCSNACRQRAYRNRPRADA